MKNTGFAKMVFFGGGGGKKGALREMWKWHIVLEHRYGRRDVIWKRSTLVMIILAFFKFSTHPIST